MWQPITESEKEQFNQLATHPLQSFEWGEFRENSGIKVIRKGFFENNKLKQAFQLTIHPIPHTSWTIGYLPKGTLPTKELIETLYTIGKQEKCIFIQLEPNVVVSRHSGLDPESPSVILSESEKSQSQKKILNPLQGKQVQDDVVLKNLNLIAAAHPLFTKYTLQIDLKKSEDDLLKAMHQKARYNIKVAQKHHVLIKEENTQKGFDTFWELTEQTTTRQQFFAHSKLYHQTQWNTLPHIVKPNTLSSHLLIAEYEKQPLTAWIVFVFNNMLYYPYGASSQEHREVMHSTLMMWEAIMFGKKHNLKTFDLWGSAAPGTPESDPWFGFTQFKERFGPERVEFVGSYDLVINPTLYQLYKIADRVRWTLLKIKK